jgi:hypothetical protein
MTFTYDEIYGVSIEEYTKRHNIDIEDLIKKTKIDIEILKENLKRTMSMKLQYPDDYIITEIFKTINKKEKHLEHLQNWRLSG